MIYHILYRLVDLSHNYLPLIYTDKINKTYFIIIGTYEITRVKLAHESTCRE
jgi:hypothetical protein